MVFAKVGMVCMEERGARGAVAALALGLALSCAPTAAAQVPDAEAPQAAVAGVRDPAAGVLELTVRATDGGSGLAAATAALDGRVLDQARFDADGCCPAVGEVMLRVPTSAVADGSHRLEVRVTDAAGNGAAAVDQVLLVLNAPPAHRPVVVVVVGSKGAPNPSPPGEPPPPGTPARCRSPRLSMALAQRPIAYRRGVPVLAAGRTYRFKGRLTCRIDGRRRSAPRGTLVQIRSRRHGRTFVKPSVRVRRDGKVVARLAFRTSRSVSFRVRSATGRLVAVRIRFHVVRLPGGRA